MQFSERWLRTLVDPPLGSEELARLLTMSGVEVEACDPVAPPFSRVVVGHVLSVEKHPNADRLTVCGVDAGTGETLKVVCGAPNVASGMRAPCALIGAKLPGESPDKPFEIRAANMRGVESRDAISERFFKGFCTFLIISVSREGNRNTRAPRHAFCKPRGSAMAPPCIFISCVAICIA